MHQSTNPRNPGSNAANILTYFFIQHWQCSVTSQQFLNLYLVYNYTCERKVKMLNDRGTVKGNFAVVDALFQKTDFSRQNKGLISQVVWVRSVQVLFQGSSSVLFKASLVGKVKLGQCWYISAQFEPALRPLSIPLTFKNVKKLLVIFL